MKGYVLHTGLIKASAYWQILHQIRPQYEYGDEKYYQHMRVIKSLKPSDAYVRHQPRPSLVQIMSWRLFGTKPLSEPMMYYCHSDPEEEASVKLYSKFTYFHCKNALEQVVWKMTAILSRPKCVKMWKKSQYVKYNRDTNVS